MSFAFHTVKQIALCLLLLPVFCCPAHAADGGKAGPSLRQVSGQGAQAAPGAAAGTAQNPEQAEAKSRGNWVKMEPGGRQAYVGIHGGTAPLSLVCSTDGVLFAFTGQTGNDFTQVLRGGNASRASANGTQHPGQSASGNGGRAPGAAVDARAVPDQTPRPAAESRPPAAEPQAARPREDGKAVPAQSSEAAPRAAAPAVGAPAAPAIGAPAAPAIGAPAAPAVVAPVSPAAAPASPAAVAPASTADAAPVSPQTKKDMAPEAAPAAVRAKAGNSADLVFASGALASSIKDAPEFLPFGLTPPAGAADDARADGRPSVPAGKPAPGPKPLKLRSYQQILKYSGSV